MKDWVFEHVWVVEGAAVLLVLLAFNLFLKKILKDSKKKAYLKENDWRLYLDTTLMAPASALFWVLLISFAIELGLRELHLGDGFLWVVPVRTAAVVICLTWFLLRCKKVFHNIVLAPGRKAKSSLDPVSLEILEKIFTIVVVFISVVIALQTFGIDVMPLLTFGGIGAAALAFASKDVFANFFGGLMLYLTRPFTVQDTIRIAGKNIEGQVEEIGWYLTSLRDAKKQPHYIPNSIFPNEALINLSRITHRRIEEVLNIRYEDAHRAEGIVEEIRNLFERSPDIDHSLVLEVFVSHFSPYALEIDVKAYTLVTRYDEYLKIKQKILLKVFEIVQSHGATIHTRNVALPTS